MAEVGGGEIDEVDLAVVDEDVARSQVGKYEAATRFEQFLGLVFDGFLNLWVGDGGAFEERLDAQLFEGFEILEHRPHLAHAVSLVVDGRQKFAGLGGDLQIDASRGQYVLPQHGVARRRRGDENEVGTILEQRFGNDVRGQDVGEDLDAVLLDEDAIRRCLAVVAT